MNYRYRVFCATVIAAVAFSSFAYAAAIEAPSLSIGVSGHGKQTLTITAGDDGAPNGFTVWWMDAAQFAANGYQWPADVVAGQGHADFTGTPTLNTFGGTTFVLAPNQSVTVEVGDLRDESGVDGNVSELRYGTLYKFVSFARDENGDAGSTLSQTVSGSTTNSTNCTYTWGYWKTHPEMWPVTSLTLGTVSYTAAELMSIFNEPVAGNGLISLAHQLIAAKLNIAAGADPSAAQQTIADADALIDGLVVPPVGSGYLAPSTTSGYTQTLDDYNNGIIGPGHCGNVPTQPTTWGSVKALYR